MSKLSKLDVNKFLEFQSESIKDLNNRIVSLNNELQKLKSEILMEGTNKYVINDLSIKKANEYLVGTYSKDIKCYYVKIISNDIKYLIKREFRNISLKDFDKNQMEKAVEIIENYEPPYVIKEKIYNAQLCM